MQLVGMWRPRGSPPTVFAPGLMPSDPYAGPWRKVRKAVLERDAHLCQIRSDGCTIRATEVDHIVPVLQGGSWYDTSNLRASCKSCNRRRVNSSASERWRTASTKITLVIGPPSAGKTTYVAKHRSPDDLVVDYDRIAEALGSDVSHGHSDAIHASVMAARNAILRSLREGKAQTKQAWIISANPRAETMFPYHRLVRLIPDEDEVLARSVSDRRPESWAALIRSWYRAREGRGDSSPAPSSREW